jgi:hypothetical protein
MRILFLLLFLFPYGLDGLLCVANGTYNNTIGQFTDALYQLTNTTVNNTLINACQVTIRLDQNAQTMEIEYHGDKIINKPSDSISLVTKMMFSMGKPSTYNNLSYVCSSVDYCDRVYIENGSQWLFNTSFNQSQYDIKYFFGMNDNDDYSSKTCYHINEMNECSTPVCYSSTSKDEVIAKCAEKHEVPMEMKLLISLNALTLSKLKTILLIINTTVMMENFWQEHNNIHSYQDKHQLNHNISYFCIFSQCNSPTISEGLKNEININYDVTKMLDFILSTQNETAFISSTQNETAFTWITPSNSTEMPDSTNRFDSMSIIAFVFIYILHCLLIYY